MEAARSKSRARAIHYYTSDRSHGVRCAKCSNMPLSQKRHERCNVASRHEPLLRLAPAERATLPFQRDHRWRPKRPIGATKKSDGRSHHNLKEMSAGRGQVGREFGEEMSVKRSFNGDFNSTSKDLSRRDILILGAGAVAVSTTAFARAGAAPRRNRASRPVGVRRSRLSGRFQAPEIRQSRRAEGRHLQPARRRRHRDVQFVQRLHSQGRCRGRHGAGVRRADVARHRRARRGLCLCRRQGHGVRRRPRLQIPPARRHHLPRWQPDHGRRRRLLADHAEDQGPSRHRQPAPRHGERRDRRRPRRGGAASRRTGRAARR